MKIQTLHGCLYKLVCASALTTLTLASAYASMVKPIVGETSSFDSVPSPSFSAIYRYTHGPSDTIVDSARVLVSEVGLRIDQTIDESGNTLIANFETNQLWFLDSQRELVHEVPVIANEPVGHDGAEQVEGLYPGFIQFAPCHGLRAEFIEQVVLHEHIVSRWQCYLDSDDWVQQQLFSTRLGVVLWSKDTDEFITELVDVRMLKPNPGVFKPPSHYRDVDLRELIQGSSSIDVYREPGSNNH